MNCSAYSFSNLFFCAALISGWVFLTGITICIFITLGLDKIATAIKEVATTIKIMSR